MTETQNENQHGSRGLMLIGLTADVAAVFALFKDSLSVVVLVLGVVAVLLSGWQLVARRGKPVDRWVLVAVVGLLAGTVAITVVATRSVADKPGQAAGPSASGQVTTTTPPSPAGATPLSSPSSTPSSAGREEAGVRRATPDDRPIKLTWDHGIDFDLDPAKPWVTVPMSSETEKTEDLTFATGFIQADKRIARMKSQPTRDDCLYAGWLTQYHFSDIAPDNWFCVKTTEGALARVKIRSKQEGQLTLEVVVWEAKN